MSAWGRTYGLIGLELYDQLSQFPYFNFVLLKHTHIKTEQWM